MTAVYKYDVILDDTFTLALPEGAEVLTVQMQHGIPRLWVRVDPTAPARPRQFRLAGTGHPIEDADDWRYVGTVQLQGGVLVLHLFESREAA